MNIFQDRPYMDDLARIKTHSQPVESTRNEGVRDTRITELEEQLIMAEKRCDALRQQVSYMKMLYACSNQPTSRGDHAELPGEETRKNSSREKSVKTLSIPLPKSPSNASPQPAATLTGDPKDAVQVIVNEMTQSVNTNTEGTLLVHSNKIEEFWVASRDNDAVGTRRYDFRSKKPKKLTSFSIQKNKVQENGSSVSEKINRPRPMSKKTSKKVEKRKSPAKQNPLPEKKPTPQNLEDTQISRKMPVLNIHSRTEVRSAVSCRTRAGSGMTYLLPTFSYRLKCVPKSCRMGFSFQKIPFVVGKSTNKSHNLGMRIQETLSLIKLTRTDIIAGKSQSKRDLTMILRQPSGEKKSADQAIPPQESCCSVKQKSAMTVRTNKCKNDQLRTVLMNIHDEFSRMTEEYDNLKSSLSEKYDPDVENQVQKLEEELDCKEIEINVFMNLYNEVAELRNKAMFNYAQGPHCNTSLAIQPSTIYRPLSCVTTSNSMMNLKMSRLLRRIDEFQKDLKTTARL